MSDHEKRFKEASDEQVYLYASDPHRIAAARAQAERTRRDRARPKGPTEEIANFPRSRKRATIMGAAVACALAILAAVAYFRAEP
jgi:hypothetical protein